MAELRKLAVKIDARVELVLTEDELMALDALAGYGVDAFIEAFYKVMGRYYLEPHEAGLRSLLKSVANCSHLAKDAKECREFLHASARL